MNISSLLQLARQRLENSHSDEPQANSEWLLAHVLNVTRTWILTHGNLDVSPNEEKLFLSLLSRKEKGEPLAYIVSYQPFCGMDILVSPDVLIPRPETEGLVELAAAHFDRKGKYMFLDMCTGSGCIALALAKKFPQAHVLAVDISEKALRVAQENAKKYKLAERVHFLQSDLWEDVTGTFDLIIANPPYIPTENLTALTAEVKHEPRLALDGGADGYEITRPLCTAAADYLNAGGLLALELDDGQARPLMRGLTEIGWRAEVKKDIFNVERFVLAQK